MVKNFKFQIQVLSKNINNYSRTKNGLKMKLNELKPAPYNPRTISEKKLKMLKKSLFEFGDLGGIVFNRRTGNLVGGHQRIKVLPQDAVIIKTELEKPTRTGTVAFGKVIVDGEEYNYREVDWSLEKEKKANIAANKHSGDWDDEALAKLLDELKELPDFDADLIGFEIKEIDKLTSQIIKNGLIDDDEVPEVNRPEPITKRGDLYILGGKHRLLCGDSTKSEDVEKLMDGKKADMVFTDPPYGMRLDTDFSNMNGLGRGKKYKVIINDDKDYDPTHIFRDFGYCKEIFLWGADYYAEKIPYRNSGSWIVWDKIGDEVKTNPTYDKMYGSNFELCWSKQKHKRDLVRVLWKGIFGLNKDDTKNRLHPTQKPIELIIWFLNKFSDLNTIILDLFLGSGSTLIACEKTGRIYYGMEIDEHYCDVIVSRYVKYTGNNSVIKNGTKVSWKLD